MHAVASRRVSELVHGRHVVRIRAWSLDTWRTPRRRRAAVALALALASAASFARIAEDYLTNDPLVRWDVSFARWLAEHRGQPALDFFRITTAVGSPVFVLASGALLVVLAYRARRLADAAFVAVVLCGAEVVNVALKLAFHRPRPEVAFVTLDTYSFPSGHAMIATAGYGALLVLAWLRLRSTRSRSFAAVLAFGLVALICFSRLYLGVHYLSDVLAGFAGGCAWLALCVAVRETHGDRFAARFDGSGIDRVGRRLTRS